jgi:hypothetical protein
MAIPAKTLCAAAFLFSSAALADAPAPPAEPTKTVTIAAGEHYRAGSVYRVFFGGNWREAWTTPIEVPVLDLATFDGGLKPDHLGGGMETKSLHFKSENDNKWAFRSVDKDPNRSLDSDTASSVIGHLLQDEISCAHPYGALMVGPLLDAVSVLHPTPKLWVLPDVPALGEFHELAGLLGLMEERNEKHLPGVTKAAETVELFERLEHKSGERVDAKNLLAARLIDILVGDWDRHILQWRWVRFEDGGEKIWKPVPRDRDQAFNEVGGLAPHIASYYTKQFTGFSPQFVAIGKAEYSGRFVDRRFLVSLSRQDWEETTADVVSKLTDAVISDAVHQLPPAIYALEGKDLEDALRSRRDALAAQSRKFYELLAGDVDVRGTSEDEELHATRQANGDVVVTLAPKQGEPFFKRTFSASETSEIRLYTMGGADHVLIDGDGAHTILIRVIAPPGTAQIEGDAKVYVPLADPPPDASMIRRFKDEAVTLNHYQPYDDSGSDVLFYPQLNFDSARGLVIGAYAQRTAHGFQLDPKSSVMDLGAAYSTGRNRPRLEYSAELQTRSPLKALIYVAFTGMDSGSYYGAGNESARDEALENANYYVVHQDQTVVNPVLDLPIAGPLHGRAGVLFKHSSAASGDVITALEPAGSGGTTVGSGQVDLVLDTRDGTFPQRNGIFFQLTGRHAPQIFSNPHAFSKVRGSIEGVVSGNPFLEMMFDARVAGEKNWGAYPFFESAQLGGAAQRSGLDVTGASTGNLLRGYELNRFAGDASLVGNTDLQITLGKLNPGLPLRFGIVALADLGRVFLEGEGSSRWHAGVGGGLWLGLFAGGTDFHFASSLQATIVHSDNGNAFYLFTGFGLP